MRSPLEAFTGIALSLLLVLTVSASAQGAETPGPYASVTGHVEAVSQHGGPDIVTSPTPPEEVVSNYVWTLALQTDDPRLSGSWVVNQSYNHFAADDVGGMFRHGIGRLTNDGGTWTSELRGYTKPGEHWHSNNHYMAWFTGEGGYEGFSAMLLMLPSGSGEWDIDGVIAQGPLPELPPLSDLPGD